MALEHAYCTLAELRAQLSDADSRVADDQLERAIDAASRAVDAWCGRRFWADETPQALVFRPEHPLRTAVDDISTTAGLTVATDADADGVYETTWAQGADFLLEPLNAARLGGAYAWWELIAVGSRTFTCSSLRPSLQVTAAFGWSAVPDQVREATILRAAALFKRKDSPHGVAGFGDFGAVRITRKDPDVMELLYPFQKVMA